LSMAGKSVGGFMPRKFVFGMIVAAWCATIIYVFFPGYIYADAYDQYQQALKGTFSDWHPPVMSAFWRLQIQVFQTGSIFYAINIAALCLSLYLLLAPYKLYASVPVFFALALCPVFFGLIAVVWKDVFLACLVLLSASIIFNRSIETGTVCYRYKAICLVLLIVASLTRANAPFITAPIILMVTIGWNARFSGLIASVLLAVALIGVSGPINHRLLGARSDNPLISLQVYDLAGISHFSGDVKLPGEYSPEDQEKIVGSCYTPVHWDVYAWGDCKFVVDKLNRKSLGKVWVNSIVGHPIAYLQHRLSHFNNLLRYWGHQPAYKYYVMVPPGYQTDSPQNQNQIHRKYTEIMEQYDRQPWHFGFIWYALSIGLLIATSCANRVPGKLVNCLSFASFAYISAYFVVGVAADFRYLLPAVFILVAATVILVGQDRGISTSKQGLAGLLTMLAIIVAGVVK